LRVVLRFISAAVFALAAGTSGLFYAADAKSPPPFAHYADANDTGLVEQGSKVYFNNCASCHGRKLQGQALWQWKDRFIGQRAPAHDETGHTWQHSDDDLFAMTKFGRFPATPPKIVSYMPAFGTTLSDRDIVAVIAFIKARWPIGLRASQAMLNPGFAGMPADAGKVQWTLPPNCIESIESWRNRSK
jgi:mono/diheme cytochrome c family protein